MDMTFQMLPKFDLNSMGTDIELQNNYDSFHEDQNEEIDNLKINVTQVKDSSKEFKVHHKSVVRNSQTQISHSVLREKQGLLTIIETINFFLIDSKHIASSRVKSS